MLWGTPYLYPHTPPGGAGLGCLREVRRAGLPSKWQNRGGGGQGRVLRSACVAELGAPFKTPVFREHSDAARCLSEGEGACGGLLYPTCLPGLCPSHCGSCQDSYKPSVPGWRRSPTTGSCSWEPPMALVTAPALRPWDAHQPPAMPGLCGTPVPPESLTLS